MKHLNHSLLRRWFAVLSLAGLMTCTVRGEPEPMPISPDYGFSWQMTLYAEDAGLDQQRVFDVAFGQDGAVWLAAAKGLYRFDGYTWSRFGTSEGLPSAFVRSVLVDQSGNLWVGTDAGAGIFDYEELKYDPTGSEKGLVNSQVREIDEDPDGTLWFSCDQWPNTSGKPGGLSCLKDGIWQSFGMTNGLPMDYCIGYFRDSSGRQFALTANGWAQRSGQEWAPPVNPGYEAEASVLQMAESKDGALFAMGENSLLILRDGRWEPMASADHSRTWLGCRTRDDELFVMQADGTRRRLWISRWDGNKFVRVSAVIPYPSGERFYHMRQAPDGSLWVVGTGTVMRWAYRDERWQCYPDLPPPLGCDQQGRIWFAEGTNSVVFENGQFKRLSPGELLRNGWNARGLALFWNPLQQQLEISDPLQPERRTPVAAGFGRIEWVQGDDAGGFWICGRSPDDDKKLIYLLDGRVSDIDASDLLNRRLFSLTPFAPQRLWLLAQVDGAIQYDMALVTDKTIMWQPRPDSLPPLAVPSWQTGAGRNWIHGYSGLYEQSGGATGDWQRVTALPDNGLRGMVASSNELLVTFTGSPTDVPGCALFTTNGWMMAAGAFTEASFGRDQQRIYLASRNGIYIRKVPGTLAFEHLQLPGDSWVNSVVDGPSGELWLGTSDGVFRYRPGRTPPVARITALDSEVPPGKPLRVSFSSLHRFEPSSPAEDFLYSWRVDNLPWSPFEPRHDNAELFLPDLGSGSHVLEVRSKDVDGNISREPARLPFTILPVPLQHRAWFYPLLGFLALILGWLVRQRMVSIQKIASANAELREEIVVRHQVEADLQRSHEELERRVCERTAELTRANGLLNQEIRERQQAEEAHRSMEEQLHQSQKMEAIGTLAGGIAHDFNNVLAIIMLHCQIIHDELSGNPELKESIEEVLKATNRAKNLVQQILTFSRQQSKEYHVIDLSPVVEEAYGLLRSIMPSTIEMTKHIDPAPPVLADPTQIHQIVMNLCVNAQHALEGRQGCIEIRMGAATVDAALCQRNPDLHPGRYACLTVRDTGHGMTPDILKRAFDPFFTTKAPGVGTGLGLAVIHGIVKNCQGAILVESQPGVGTEIRIYFPAQSDPLKPHMHTITRPNAAKGAHILIVDDEAVIAKVLERLLLSQGYRVTMHTDSRAALAAFRTNPADFDLMLADLTMPGLNGRELAEQVFGIRPDLPVVLATGFSGGPTDHPQVMEQGNIRGIVQKPFSSQEILQLIADMLGPSGSP